jgi:hypothetical protein
MSADAAVTRVLVITDLNGELLGVLQADPVDAGNGVTIQAVPVSRPEQRHHFVDVPSHLLAKSGRSAEELHREIRRRLAT